MNLGTGRVRGTLLSDILLLPVHLKIAVHNKRFARPHIVLQGARTVPEASGAAEGG